MWRSLQLIPVLSLLIAAVAGNQPAQAEVQFQQQSPVGNELKLPVHRWFNPDTPTKGIIVANQGLVFTGKAYDAIARHLAEEGYVVYAQDFRGFGDWLTDHEKFNGDANIHFTQTKEDLTSLLKLLRDHFPGTPICLLGESLGANYSIWEASTEPKLLDGVIATSTCFQLRVHPRPLWFVTFAQGITRPKRPVNVGRYLAPILSDDKKLTKDCLQDPEVCTKMSPTDLVKAMITNRYSLEQLEQIPPQMPMLIIAGKKDQIQNSKKINSALNRIGSKKVKVVVLPQRGHLLLEHQQVDPEVAKTVDQWLAENIPLMRTASIANSTPVVPTRTAQSAIRND